MRRSDPAGLLSRRKGSRSFSVDGKAAAELGESGDVRLRPTGSTSNVRSISELPRLAGIVKSESPTYGSQILLSTSLAPVLRLREEGQKRHSLGDLRRISQVRGIPRVHRSRPIRENPPQAIG